MPTPYTAQHVRVAKLLAKRIRASAQRRGAVELACDPGDGLGFHELGALGELVVAEYLGLSPLRVNRRGGADPGWDLVDLAGWKIQVRTRDKRAKPWGDLIVQEAQSVEADATVLVWIEEGGRYTLPGWASPTMLREGSTSLERRDGMRLRKFPWRDLRPVAELAP